MQTNPTDFLTLKRFPDGPGQALYAGYYEPDSALELLAATIPAPGAAFVHPGPDFSTPQFLYADFTSALRAALLQDLELGSLAAAALAASGAVAVSGVVNATRDHRSFLLRYGLLYRRGQRGDRLCIPAAGGLRLQVFAELHFTPLGGHFGRDKTLALARRSVWWPGLPQSRSTSDRFTCHWTANASKPTMCRPPACSALFACQRAAAAASASTSSNFR